MAQELCLCKETTYANNEYRKEVLGYIKDNYKDRKDQAFGATVFTYFISVLKEYGENTDKFANIEIDTVNVRYNVLFGSSLFRVGNLHLAPKC
jgi:hypothetical protein